MGPWRKKGKFGKPCYRQISLRAFVIKIDVHNFLMQSNLNPLSSFHKTQSIYICSETTSQCGNQVIHVTKVVVQLYLTYAKLDFGFGGHFCGLFLIQKQQFDFTVGDWCLFVGKVLQLFNSALRSIN